MPETSMVGLEEKYSTSIKKMSKVTKAFSKDEEEMEALLEQLSKNKCEIGLDVSKAERELEKLREDFISFGKGDRNMLVEKEVALEGMREKQQLVNQELKKAEDYMQGITEDGIFEKLRKSGLLQMAGQIGQKAVGTLGTSFLGNEGGKMASSIVSYAGQGAAIGSMLLGPGLGTATGVGIGAGAGAFVGVIDGSLEIFEDKDTAFKSHIKGMVDSRSALRENEMLSGSTYAAQREKAMADALTRLESEGATPELIQSFQSWGIDGMGLLAKELGVWRGEIYDKVAAGEVGGEEAAEILRQAVEKAFPHAMLESGETYLSKTTQLEKQEQELNGIMGSAYNKTALTGLQADYEAFQGPLGEEMKAMNSMIGEGRGMAENMERQYQREALSMLATGEGNTLYEGESQKRLEEMHQEYAAMKTEFDTTDEARKAEIGAQIEALKSEAESLAKDAYSASETGIALRDTELGLIEAIRANTQALGGAAWNREYLVQQEESKGMLNGQQTLALRNWRRDHPEEVSGSYAPESPYLTGEKALAAPASSYLTGGYAYGLERVPYDNFPALLHQGERVLTAAQARAEDRGGGGVKVEIGQVSFGSSVSDPAQAAEIFARELERELLLARPG